MSGVIIVRGIFLLFLIPVFLWLTYDRITLYKGADLHEAVITSCKGKWVEIKTMTGHIPSRTTREQVQYAPVAKTKNGLKGVGNYWLTQKLCQRTIGQKTKVLVDNNDKKIGAIYSFINFWLLPSFFLIFIILFLVFEKSKLFNRLLVLLFISVSAYLIAKELNFLPTEANQLSNGRSLSSVNPLQKCINSALLKDGLNKPEEIKSISCIDAKIIDLSGFSGLINLQKLIIQDERLQTLETMPKLVKLKELHVSGGKMLTSLKGLSNLPNLEFFSANKGAIEDIGGLVTLTKLKKLELSMNNISDISSLRGLSMLERVILNYNNISSIDALGSKLNLKHLQLHANRIGTIQPLYTNKAMVVFGVSGGESISCEELDEIRTLLSPSAKVFGPKYCDG